MAQVAWRTRWRISLALLAFWGAAAAGPAVHAQKAPPKAAGLDDEDPPVVEPPKLPDPPGAVRLVPTETVWIDRARKLVLVDGYVSLREGYLEMFACLAGTKEHESVVAVRSRAQTIHAALLAVGAKVGRPASFTPEFRPASGSEINVEAHWLDERGKWQKVRAQEWVLDRKTNKPMIQPWVFAGSGWWTDEKDGKKYYMAEAGDFICVSNFATAMLDIPIESSQSNDALVFVANTKRIPPLGMPIRLTLQAKADGERGEKPEHAPASKADPASASSEPEAPTAKP